MSSLLVERAILGFGCMYLLWKSGRGHGGLWCWCNFSLMRERGARAHFDILGYGVEMEAEE